MKNIIDYIVIGAGASGSAFAWKMSKSGAKVVCIEQGDYVICAVSGKNIPLQKLTYWNVELQEAYFSYKEASVKREKKN